MLTPNTLLQNRYLVIRLIAQGGMGAVYEARDQRLNNTVALKECFFAGEEMRRAFHREAGMLATLRHQALPKVIDHFTEGDGQFLAMEFIRGEDLSQILEMRGMPIPQRDALAWADQLLSALEYLHSQRPPIIHRDIKPQNLKLNERGEIILLDFGLAKEAALDTSQINRSVRGYTLKYAPLEQIQGVGTDTRSDLYSVAATTYHLLTGTTPADALTRAAASIEGAADPLRPAHELNPAVGKEVSAVLEKALSLDRNRRQPTATIMREELRKASSIATREAAAHPTEPIAELQTGIQEAASTQRYPGPESGHQATAVRPDFAEKAKGGSKLWLIGGIVALSLAAIAAFLYFRFSRPVTTEISAVKTDSSTSTTSAVFGDAQQIASRDIFASSAQEEMDYSFTALPGELKLTLDVIGAGSTVNIEMLDAQKKPLRFNDGKSSLSLSSTGEHERTIGRLISEREQPLLLRVKTAYPQSLQALRLRIDGPAKLPDPQAASSAASPLAALFAARDNPAPLSSREIFAGQNGKKQSYYSFNAGPGEIRFTLNVIAAGSTVTVDLFDEESDLLRFQGGSSRLSAGSSSGTNEQTSSKIALDGRKRLLMRIQNPYPEGLTAYRLSIDGPAEISPGGDGANEAANSLRSLFLQRDNPEPLRSKEISDRSIGKEYYFLVTAGPGTLKLSLEVEGAGSTVAVEFFDSEQKPVQLGSGSTRFSVSSIEKKEKNSIELTLPREERLLMRLSSNYPESLKSYKLKFDGPIKKT